MNTRLLSRLVIFVLGILLLVGIITAAAAANTVPPSRLADQTSAIDPLVSFRPTECDTLNLNNFVLCPAAGGDCHGGNGNSRDLILGSQYDDNITAGNGNDCIVGGGGNDTINGGPGTDVCIGGPGTDTFPNCETWIQQ
jgi:hypothetical protein